VQAIVGEVQINAHQLQWKVTVWRRETGVWLSREEDIFPKSWVELVSPLVVCIFSRIFYLFGCAVNREILLK
jgi:hypothetical protein